MFKRKYNQYDIKCLCDIIDKNNITEISLFNLKLIRKEIINNYPQYSYSLGYNDIRKIIEDNNLLGNKEILNISFGDLNYKKWVNYNIDDFIKANRKNIKIDHNLYETFINFKFNNHYSMFNHEYNFYQKSLYESLSYSYNIEYLEKKLYSNFNDLIKYSLLSGDYNNLPDGLYLYLISDEYFDDIEKLCNFYGYFIAQTYKENNLYVYIIESTYGVTEMTDIIYENTEILNNLYHITTPIAYNKIKKVGLYPKANNKLAKHPERIYLAFDEEPFNNLKELANKLYPDGNYIILKVDLTKNNFKIKLFADPAYSENGVFTKENISPKCISLFKLS